MHFNSAQGAAHSLRKTAVVRLGICSAALLLGLGDFSAIAASAPPAPISVWTRAIFNTEEGKVILGAAASFNRSQHAYRVEVFSSSYRNYGEWVKSVGITGSLPCVLEIDGPYVAEFAWTGYLQSLDAFVTHEMRADLLPSIIAQGSYAGHLYSLGQFDSGLGLWANRRYLTAAHVRIPTVAQPWILAEFEQAMQKLAGLKGVDYPLNLALYSGTNEFYTYAFLPILAGFGGDLIDRRTYRSAKGVLDGPQSVAAMKRFQDWFRRGWTLAVFDRTDDFERGRTALSWTGHWKYGDYRAALGDDLVLLPLPNFGRGIKTGMGSWGWGITSTCQDPAGAWAFLAYLLTTKEILYMTNVNGAVPARWSALAQSPLYGDRGRLEVFSQQLASGAGVSRPTTPGYGAISKAFSDAVGSIITGADVQSALSRAADAINSDIAANRGYPQ
jgi:multiple sugar transport system substrate-binding protein